MNKILRKGLELLNQRENSSIELEQLLKYMPPIANVFFKYYDTEEYNLIFNDGILSFPDGFKCGVTKDKWFDNVLIGGKIFENSFDKLLSIGDLMIEIQSFLLKTEIWHIEGFIKIGYFTMNDIILLGFTDKTLDEIWCFGDSVSDFTKLSNNIFEFFSNVIRFYSDNDLKEYSSKYSGSDIFKNWGEDFWRLREK